MRLTRSRPSPSRRPGCWVGRRVALGTQAHRSFQDGVSQLWRGLLQSVVPAQGDPCSTASMGLVCAVKKSRSASFPAAPKSLPQTCVPQPAQRPAGDVVSGVICASWATFCFSCTFSFTKYATFQPHGTCCFQKVQEPPRPSGPFPLLSGHREPGAVLQSACSHTASLGAPPVLGTPGLGAAAEPPTELHRGLCQTQTRHPACPQPGRSRGSAASPSQPGLSTSR